MKIKNVRHILFDLDDTLCDYKGASQRAIQEVNRLLSQKPQINTDLFWKRYKESEPSMFKKFLANEITRSQYRMDRFRSVLATFDELSDSFAAELNHVFMKATNEGISLFEDVHETLSELSKSGVEMSIITNGPSDTQRRKIESFGIDHFFTNVFVSEKIGFAKPDERFFNVALSELSLTATDVIVVGDSYEYDITGAIRIGAHSILVDREGRFPNYQGARIRQIRDLLPLVS